MPWHEGTALCLADLAWGDGSPVVASPRQILRAQLDRLRRARAGGVRGHRARVHRLPRHLRGGVREGLPRPQAGQPLQHRLLAPRHRARRAADPPHPQRDGAAPGCASRAPRASATTASTRSTSATAPALRDRRRARDLQDRRQGDRRPGGHGDHVHGQVRRARGQLVPHPPLAAARRRSAAVRRRRGRLRALRRRPARLPARADAASRAQRQLLQALRAAARSRPRRSPGAATTARARCASSATATRCGWSCACRRRRQPVPGAGRDDRRRACTASTASWSSSPRSRATRTWPTSRTCRRRWPRRARCSRPAASRGGRSARRSSTHYVNAARVELEAFEAVVTDWERARGFERL